MYMKNEKLKNSLGDFFRKSPLMGLSFGRTPREQGYHMPAEWEPHKATWLAWPHNPETWPGKVKRIPPLWMQMIKPLHLHEEVHLLVNDQATEDQVRMALRRWDIESKPDSGNIFFHQIPTDDCWMRDAGPVFVKNDSGLALVKSKFNKWGEKYPPWEVDDAIPGRVNEFLKLPFFEMGIVLEGGSIDVNGRGTLLTTEQCLLNKNRNPHLKKEEIEKILQDFLGVTKILWLGDGIAGDDTDGHIDDIARFVAPTTVVCAVEENPADANYQLLQENLKRLRTMTDQDGKKLEIVTLPMPGPLFYDNQRLPASYANFYIANNVVLVPTYSHPNDKRALEIIQKLFPARRVVGIECTDMVWGLGAIHCVTQQQPVL